MDKYTPINYLPAEWYPQSGVQLTWPHSGTDWAYMLNEVRECFIRIAVEVAKREILLIVTPEPEEVSKQISPYVNMDNVRLAQCVTNDTWARDHGAITQILANDPYIMDFTFNGWGLKYAANYDNLITRKLFSEKRFCAGYRKLLNLVLEGGSIESDGEGTLLTTSECLLSPNRNPWLDKETLEKQLCDLFNLKQILWLDYGFLAGDDTDSHIDTLARFCSPGSIAYVKCEEPCDEHFEALRNMEKQLKTFRTLSGEPYELIALPMADKIEENGERLPATYANFLIINGAVLYPTYNQPKNDEKAAKQLQHAFPDREIIGIDCCPLIKQHGSLHCVTMQYPLNVLK